MPDITTALTMNTLPIDALGSYFQLGDKRYHCGKTGNFRVEVGKRINGRVRYSIHLQLDYSKGGAAADYFASITLMPGQTKRLSYRPSLTQPWVTLRRLSRD